MTGNETANSVSDMRDAIRAARRLAGRLPLPDPWRVEDLCTQVADSRQRPIVLIERAAQGDSITAMVIGTQTTDYIFCREDLKGLHRDHAICHELGHLLAGHTEQIDLVATFRLAPVDDHDVVAESGLSVRRASRTGGGGNRRRDRATG